MTTEDLVGNYENKVNSLRGLLMKIKETGKKVYDSNLLDEAYKLAEFW